MQEKNTFQKNTLLGQSLYEVVFAIGISAIIITGVVVLATRSISNSTFSRNNSVATKYVQEALEWLRSERDLDWTTFEAHATGSVCEAGSLDWSCSGCTVGEIFCRTLVLISAPPDRVDAEVEVSWDDSSGSHSVKSNTTFTNWKK